MRKVSPEANTLWGKAAAPGLKHEVAADTAEFQGFNITHF